MPNSRISDLTESDLLYTQNFSYNYSYQEPVISESEGVESFLLIAREKSHNEKISLDNFSHSIIDNSMYLTGNQLVSGHKVFKDKCTFEKQTRIHKFIDVTETGDISGYIFGGASGLFDNLNIGDKDFQRSVTGDAVLNLSGTALFDGSFTLSGDLLFGGTLNLNNNIISAELIATGTASFNEDIYTIGNVLRSGNLYQTGNQSIEGDMHVFDDFSGVNNIYHLDDTDTFIKYNEDNIEIAASTGSKIKLDNTIELHTNNQTNLNITGEHVVIGDSQITGNLSAGTSYIENLYSKNINTFERFNAVFDESMCFRTRIPAQSDRYTIQFPKVFEEKPLVVVSLENSNGENIMPISISDVTEEQFILNLGAETATNNYIAHTIASPQSNSVYSTNPNIQKFITPIINTSNVQTISFPNSHSSDPILSTSIEGPNNIIPYVISGVNNTNYTIIFGSDINSQYNIHTISTTVNDQFID